MSKARQTPPILAAWIQQIAQPCSLYPASSLSHREKHTTRYTGHISALIHSSILLSGREKLNKMIVFPQTSHWEEKGVSVRSQQVGRRAERNKTHLQSCPAVCLQGCCYIPCASQGCWVWTSMLSKMERSHPSRSIWNNRLLFFSDIKFSS